MVNYPQGNHIFLSYLKINIIFILPVNDLEAILTLYQLYRNILNLRYVYA